MRRTRSRLVLGATLTLGLGWGPVSGARAGEGLDPGLRAFVEAVAALRDRALDAPAAASDRPMEAALAALLSGLGDPATRYLTAAEFRNLSRSTDGRFHGFGMVVVSREGGLVVDRTYPASPAARAGVRAGDRIEATGTPPRPVADLDTLRSILEATSEPGLLLAFRRGQDRFEVRIRPGPVSLPTVESSELEAGVLYLRIHSFSDRTPEELSDSLRGAHRRRGLILDLRANAGGVLEAAVEAAGSLAGPGPVTWMVDRSGRRQERKTSRRREVPHPPAAVLVDRNTASAAEVLAARLARAGSLLVGDRSYGKSTVQEVIPLSNGGAAILTVARYEIAPGEPLPATGLAPEVQVAAELPPADGREASPPFPPDPGSDPVLRTALDHVLGRAPRR